MTGQRKEGTVPCLLVDIEAGADPVISREDTYLP
jgi:hypothetical protein